MYEILCDQIIQAAVEVHEHLGGPGLLETVYESALCHELTQLGLSAQRQMQVPVLYKNHEVREPLFLDILVDHCLVIEVKATGKDYPYYHAQLATYLRLANIPYGLLLNFGKQNVKESVIHMQNDRIMQ